MSTLDTCDYLCAACERECCRESDVSPGESDGICADCYHEEIPNDAA